MFYCFYVYDTLSSLFFLLLILSILIVKMSNALISPTEMQLKLKKEIAENTDELQYEGYMKVLQNSVRRKKLQKYHQKSNQERLLKMGNFK